MTALFVSVLIFFCSSKICTVLFYRFWLKNLKNCVQDVLKKLLPAPKLDLRRYVRKQCLLGIKKKKILNVNYIQPYSIYIVII